MIHEITQFVTALWLFAPLSAFFFPVAFMPFWVVVLPRVPALAIAILQVLGTGWLIYLCIDDEANSGSGMGPVWGLLLLEPTFFGAIGSVVAVWFIGRILDAEELRAQTTRRDEVK